MTRVRRPAAAGTFYPARPEDLGRQVDSLLAAAPAHPLAGTLVALVVPHAGYVYSGHVAAHAYSLLARHRTLFSRVLLLGPTHRVGCPGLALPGADVFQTGLGPVAVDTELAAALGVLPFVDERPDVHRDEHALEVQLPFLLRTARDLPVLPVCVGHAPPDQVGTAIETALDHDPRTLVVVSTDLSHYLPDDQARRLDAATLDQVLHLTGPLRPDQACGAAPLNGLLVTAAHLGWRPHLLAHATSADTLGDRDRVVGYAALALTQEVTP